MSEEQLKAADADAAKEEEEAVEEISEEDLGGVAGGVFPFAEGGGDPQKRGGMVQTRTT